MVTGRLGERIRTKINDLYDMVNPKMNIEVQILDEGYKNGLMGVYNMKDVEKSYFHEFVDEFEGEIIIKHIDENNYKVKFKNADYQQTKKKLQI